jgi:hypothetical protein
MKMTWPQALVASSVLIVIAALTLAGKDASALVTSGLAILGALGFLVKQNVETKEQTTAVKEQTNGNTKELLAIIRLQQSQIMELSHKLADSMPAPRD